MKAKKFYINFVVVYGTCWLVPHILSFITQSHIDTGLWGYYGFPLLGLGYAIFQGVLNRDRQHEFDDLRQRIAEIEFQQLDQKYKLSDIERNVQNQNKTEAE